MRKIIMYQSCGIPQIPCDWRVFASSRLRQFDPTWNRGKVNRIDTMLDFLA